MKSEKPELEAIKEEVSKPKHSKSVSHKHKSPKIVKSRTPATKFQLKSERDIAMDFAASVHKRFDTLVKATILFGSQAKNTAKPSSDIDIIIVIDDASVDWDLELVAWYREELGKILGVNKYARELHVNTIKLTTWWQDLMHGDPVVLNILRYGEALLDIGGFFTPLKVLLARGKINSTPESVYNALQRSPTHLVRSRIAEAGAIEGVYWCMVDAAQAALITAGLLPPSPEHIPEMLKEKFVDSGIMRMDFVTWYRDVFALHKGIIHGKITNVRGADIDVWQERAETFLKKMTEIIDNLISRK